MKSLAAAVMALAFVTADAGAASVRFLAWDHEVSSRKILVRCGGKDLPIVDLHPDKRSEPVTNIAADADLVLVTPESAGADGNPATVRVKIPAGMNEPLLILLPDRGNPAGIRGFVVEDAAGSFKYGSTRFLNTTGRPLALRCEKQVVRLEKSWLPVDVDPGGSARNVGVQMATLGATSTVLYSAVWEYDPRVRKLALIIGGGPAGAVDVKVIAERRSDAAVP